MVIDPTCGRYPWLTEHFRLLPPRETGEMPLPDVRESETAP
jgi:hypothetical protein